MKLWAAQTKISAQTDVKILLTKVDATNNQIAQLERSLADAHKQIKTLHAAKQDLHAQLWQMVHVSELHAARTETSKVREAHDGLGQQLRSTQGEVDKLQNAIQVREQRGGPDRGASNACSVSVQGMVARAELLAALSEVKASKEEAAAKAKELAWLEGQAGKGQEQLNAARVEVAQLQAAMSGMVPRGDVEELKRQLKEVEASARAEGQAHRDLVAGMNERLRLLEDEKSGLLTKMQVVPRCRLAALAPFDPPSSLCRRKCPLVPTSTPQG